MNLLFSTFAIIGEAWLISLRLAAVKQYAKQLCGCMVAVVASISFFMIPSLLWDSDLPQGQCCTMSFESIDQFASSDMCNTLRIHRGQAEHELNQRVLELL